MPQHSDGQRGDGKKISLQGLQKMAFCQEVRLVLELQLTFHYKRLCKPDGKTFETSANTFTAGM
jgi:hypothetical protein